MGDEKVACVVGREYRWYGGSWEKDDGLGSSLHMASLFILIYLSIRGLYSPNSVFACIQLSKSVARPPSVA
jgi:hypothetical protein